jgi:hypothetical protein
MGLCRGPRGISQASKATSTARPTASAATPTAAATAATSAVTGPCGPYAWKYDHAEFQVSPPPPSRPTKKRKQQKLETNKKHINVYGPAGCGDVKGLAPKDSPARGVAAWQASCTAHKGTGLALECANSRRGPRLRGRGLLRVGAGPEPPTNLGPAGASWLTITRIGPK